MELLMHSTSTALWHDIIHHAEETCAINLNEELESYLVFLLIRYIDKPELIKQIIATQFLTAIQSGPAKREQTLRAVGDQCLLFTGLFPRMAEKRLLKLSYFVQMGQAAYIGLSMKQNDLYGALAEQFVSLMDILQSIRQYNNCPDLLPLQAFEQWHDTGSQRALKVLKQYTDAIPFIQKGKKF